MGAILPCLLRLWGASFCAAKFSNPAALAAVSHRDPLPKSPPLAPAPAGLGELFQEAGLTRPPWPGINIPTLAGVTQLVECNLAKVDVEGSSPFTRSPLLGSPPNNGDECGREHLRFLEILLVLWNSGFYTPRMSLKIDGLRKALEETYDPALDFLEKLVGTNSHTGNIEGVRANAALIERQFLPMGFHARRIPCRLPGTAEHLVLDSGGSGPAIACVSHLDTVFSAAEERSQNFSWRREGTRVYGPGTYDIKGGTALLWMMMSALEQTCPEVFRSVRWLLIWNAAEERLAEDFCDVCLSQLPPATLACLVFEGDEQSHENYAILGQRKGTAKFRISVQGRGAHAGNNHAKGANAIRELAGLVERLELMTDPSGNLSVNIGILRGGTSENRVPHEAEAFLEIRSYELKILEEAMARILSLQGDGRVRALSDGFPCRISVERTLFVPPWEGGDETARLASFWQEASRDTGDKLSVARRGGISDANKLSAYFPALDGLGPRGGNSHASEFAPDGSKSPEFVDVSSFVFKALLNAVAIIKFLESGGDLKILTGGRLDGE